MGAKIGFGLRFLSQKAPQFYINMLFGRLTAPQTKAKKSKVLWFSFLKQFLLHSFERVRNTVILMTFKGKITINFLCKKCIKRPFFISKISFINFRLGFLAKLVSFSLAANLAAKANFYKVPKNQLLMYSHMWNASSNVFFEFDYFFPGGKRGGNKKFWLKLWNLTINAFKKVKCSQYYYLRLFE